MAFFSDSSLRLAAWWAENRRKFREVRTVIFLALVFVLLVVDAVEIALLAGTDREVSAALLDRTTRISEVAVADQPKPPVVKSTAAVAAGPAIFDLAAKLENPNAGWLGSEVKVHFKTSAGDTPVLTTFLLPATSTAPSRRLVVLPHVALSSTDGLTLVVDSVTWRRVPARDLELVGAEPITVNSAKLIPTQLASGLPATRGEVELSNPSVYGYQHVEVALAVERAGTVLAVRRTTAERLESGGTATVVSVWEQRFPDDATLTVDPAVNPFDPSVRLPR